jgi:hypothetical protein
LVVPELLADFIKGNSMMSLMRVVIGSLNYYGSAITAVATVAIAAFTWTLRRASIQQGKFTQTSINMATPHPLLTISTKGGVVLGNDQHHNNSRLVAFTIFNHGGAPAIIEAAFCSLVNKSATPPAPVSQDILRNLVPGFVINACSEGGENCWIPLSSPLTLDTEILVTVTYKETSGAIYETSGLWKYRDGKHNSFVQDGGAKYNYVNRLKNPVSVRH